MFKNKKNVIFIDSLLLYSTKNITAISVKHQKRYRGESNYNIKNLFSLWFDMIENYHFFPIRLGSIIGFVANIFVKIIRIKFLETNKKIEIKSKNFI